MEYLAVHDNDNQGIGTMNGTLRHSELYNNGTDASFGGITAAAVKGIDEYEAGFNYVHDNPANGLWCDVGCEDSGTAMPNGFWVHDNLVVDNGRSGIRYESAPEGLATGVHASEPTALIEGNEVHGNSFYEDRGGISVVDAQNALIRNNVFGAKTIDAVVGTNIIDSVAYGPNAPKPGAVKARDSGKTSRTDLYNIGIQNNTMNGEGIRGCELPDQIVDCHDATPPTLSELSPAGGAANVALDAEVRASFSEPMDASTLTGITFTLRPAVKGATPLAAAVSYDPTTDQATLDPNVALQAGESYTAKVKGGSYGVEDSAGNPMASEEVWSFTTLPPAPSGDTTAPRVTATDPPHTATGVSPSTAVTAAFSEKMMDPSSITDSTFKLLKLAPDGSTTRLTDAGVKLSTDGLAATLEPFGGSATLLQKGTTYRAVVSPGATDEAGNQLDQDATTSGLQRKAWSFTVSN